MITAHFYKMGRAAADSRSTPNRIATLNAATPRAGKCNRQAPQLFELLACNVNFLWEGAREGYLFSKKRYPSLIRVLHTRWKKPELIVPKGTVRYFLLQQKPF